MTEQSRLGVGGSGGFSNAIRGGLPSPIPLRDGPRMSLPGIYAAEPARRHGELLEIACLWSA